MSECVATVAETFADGRIRWRCPCGLSGITPHTIDKVHLPNECRRIDLTRIPKPAQPCGGCQQRQETLNNIIPGAGDAVAVLAKPIAKAIDAMAGTNIAGRRPTLLIRFPHGLGDCVQLSVVLRHIRELHPEWDVDVQVKDGRAKMLRHLCRQVHENGDPKGYDIDVQPGFPEPTDSYRGVPTNKPTQFLKQKLRIEPRPELCGYDVHWDEADEVTARDFMRRKGLEPRRFVVMHYQGESATDNKTLHEEIAADVVRQFVNAGLKVVILNWSQKSGLTKMAGVVPVDFSAENFYPADGAAIGALANFAFGTFGIDSGPGHVFASARLAHVPMIKYWKHHHPGHYSWAAPHVLHVVPSDHANQVTGEAVLATFLDTYRYAICERHPGNLLPKLAKDFAADPWAAMATYHEESRQRRWNGTEFDVSAVLDLVDDEPDCLLNVGVGQEPHCEAEQFTHYWPGCKTVGWEPNPVTFEQRIGRYPGELRRCGLWSEAGEREFWPTGDLGNSSMLPALPDYAKSLAIGDPIRVRVETLDQSSLPQFERAFLWLDIEGAELHALRGGAKLLESGRVRWILCEVSDKPRRDGEPTADELDAYLAQFGYAPLANETMAWSINRIYRLSR